MDDSARHANLGMEPKATGAVGAQLGLLARTAGRGRNPGRGPQLEELRAKVLFKAQTRDTTSQSRWTCRTDTGRTWLRSATRPGGSGATPGPLQGPSSCRFGDTGYTGRRPLPLRAAGLGTRLRLLCVPHPRGSYLRRTDRWPCFPVLLVSVSPREGRTGSGGVPVRPAWAVLPGATAPSWALSGVSSERRAKALEHVCPSWVRRTPLPGRVSQSPGVTPSERVSGPSTVLPVSPQPRLGSIPGTAARPGPGDRGRAARPSFQCLPARAAWRLTTWPLTCVPACHHLPPLPLTLHGCC